MAIYSLVSKKYKFPWRMGTFGHAKPRLLKCSLRWAIALLMAATTNSYAELAPTSVGCPSLASAANIISMDQPKWAPVANETIQVCEITFEELRTKQRTFVDIRDGNAFAKMNLQGSLNLPLSSLRHRDFLKSLAIVLIDEGKSPSALVRACSELRSQGFVDVRALAGGLRTLHANGASVQADARAIQNLYQLTPAEFDSEAGRPGWFTVGINLGNLADSQSTVALRETLNTTGDAKAAATKLKSLLERQPGDTLIVVAANDVYAGEVTETLSIVQKSRVLTLAGGMEAFQRYQKQQANVVAHAGKPLVRPCSEL